jgi:hypothetical protein
MCPTRTSDRIGVRRPIAACAAVGAALAGCGGGAAERVSTTPSAATVGPPPAELTATGTGQTAPSGAPAGLTAAQRAEVARRRVLMRPRFSRPEVGRRVAGLAPERARAALVRALRRSILNDARQRARRGTLRGPFLDTSCEVIAEDRALARDPAAPVLRYSCLAVTFRSRTAETGTPFLARLDVPQGRYAWCAYIPVGGEGAHTALTFQVPPPAACAGRLR